MLTWAVILIGIALFLFALEIFIPSGGLISVFASIAMVGGLTCLYIVDFNAGLIATIVVIVAAPFGVILAFRIFPHTPIGRGLMLNDRQETVAANPDPARRGRRDDLLGATGVAVTEMRPVGTCRFNGGRVECLAEGGLIDAGTDVKVTAVDGMHIKVRRV